ncbi:MurR/RpiR family transcriptional regulator [Gemmobacter lutimaris]|uniref:MurR/RpiR family transcriptional regulator n=1 Tax=Gemmobacter lutimaris TaxID=2306023 RepID=A0A398BIJ2_9RHOB|nr:MurR/RpiR family transcriptional regulator [Gemmobacter lutimaris]RID90242.1 MurR/RpiR family transcriptional regulator [Gemmobacter lutimaris]
MKQTNEPHPATSLEILERIQALRAEFTPELAKLAGFLLENPNEIGVCSIRQLAAKADVKPNTLVRLSRAIGIESYESFREVFRNEIRQGRETYPDRARWLQSVAQRDEMGALFAASAESAIDNIEGLFASTDHRTIQAAAREIVSARRCFALGVGVNNAIAQNFAYLAGMAIDGVRALPQGGTQPVDGLARANENDVLIAMTFRPYRREIVEAVAVARAQRVRVIAISDSLASPIMPDAQHRFVVPTDTPQFFISTVALTAFFEVLIAFIIAEAGEDVVSSIESYHSQRHALGIYVGEKDKHE